MKTVMLAVVAAFAVGCARPSVPVMTVRGITLNTDATDYGSTFSYHGSIIAPSDAKGMYVAVVSFRLISGGGDEIKKEFATTQYTTIPVVAGSGEFTLGAGYRKKKTSYQEADTWEPARFEVAVVGAFPVTTFTFTK